MDYKIRKDSLSLDEFQSFVLEVVDMLVDKENKTVDWFAKDVLIKCWFAKYYLIIEDFEDLTFGEAYDKICDINIDLCDINHMQFADLKSAIDNQLNYEINNMKTTIEDLFAKIIEVIDNFDKTYSNVDIGQLENVSKKADTLIRETRANNALIELVNVVGAKLAEINKEELDDNEDENQELEN